MTKRLGPKRLGPEIAHINYVRYVPDEHGDDEQVAEQRPYGELLVAAHEPVCLLGGLAEQE